MPNPAPSPEFDSDIEGMCAASWNLHAAVPWGSSVPADKDFYRRCMQAALDVYLKNHRYDNETRDD